MIERRNQELELVRREFGEIQVGPNLEWVIINSYSLPPGWNKTETAVLVLIPAGYPVTPPDSFFTDNGLRIADSRQPGNTALDVQQLNRHWLQFSVHVEKEDWKPHADLLKGHNLLTFLHGVERRLSEVN